MAVSDLTNTTWVINGYGSVHYDGSMYINFTSNNTNYTEITFYTDDVSITYNTTRVCEADDMNNYTPSDWVNEAYRTISITDGQDVTNATLIAWLEANATQQGSASLTDTKWRFKDTPDLSSFPAAGTSYSINFTSNSNNYTLLKLATYAITYNTTEVYTGTAPLVAPSIALSSDELTITDNDGNATGFKVYWDGSTTVADTIIKTS